MGIGQIENIQGWNPAFRVAADNSLYRRFDAFAGNAPCWTFNRQEVEGYYAGEKRMDLQSHIVPLSQMKRVLGPVAKAAFEASPRPNSFEDLNVFLMTNYPSLKFQSVTNYINWKLIGEGGAPEQMFVNPKANSLENYLGGYFAVVLWNPVNICRAPALEYRFDYDGATLDVQVLNFLLKHPMLPGIEILPHLSKALDVLYKNNCLKTLASYISVCNDCFENQLFSPTGYYQFSWEDQAIDVLKKNNCLATGLVPGFKISLEDSEAASK